MTGLAAEDLDDEEVLDSLTIGRRIRQLRTDRGMTLDDLATVLDRAPSQVSVIENGKRELKLGELQRLARALETTLDDLLSPEPPSRRAALEIALERAQRGPLYASLGLPALPVRKSLSDEAIETILGLHAELQRLHSERAATPEEARRANVGLRAEQRRRGNYFRELETTARDLLEAIGHRGGPLSQRLASELAAHLGFTLHYVADLPSTTRSVTDHRNGRIYLPVRQSAGGDPRSALLQALAAHVLGKQEPRDYAELLRLERANAVGRAMLYDDSLGNMVSVMHNPIGRVRPDLTTLKRVCTVESTGMPVNLSPSRMAAVLVDMEFSHTVIEDYFRKHGCDLGPMYEDQALWAMIASKSSATMLMILIIGLTAGPAVSL